MTHSEPSTSFRRRTLVSGGAWAVPAIAIASAAPASAQSPSGILVTLPASGCRSRLNGDADLRFTLTVINERNTPVDVAITSVSISARADNVTFPGTITVQSDGSQAAVVTFAGGNQTQPSDRTVVVTYNLGNPMEPLTVTGTVSFATVGTTC